MTTLKIKVKDTEEFRIMKKCYADLCVLEEKIKKDFEKIYTLRANKYIDDWYNSYDPYRHMYKPRYSLKEAYKVELGDNSFRVIMSPKLIKKQHNQSNYVIYENSFVNGYHGGSYGIQNPYDAAGVSITESDGPHFRTPAKEDNKYAYWGNPAVRSQVGLEELLEDLVYEVVDIIHNKYIKKYTDIMQKYNDAQNKLIG